MKLDKADVLFSKYVRTRDNWTCQRCGRGYVEGDRGLQCSHYFGRRMESVRFDPENCDSLCFGCHRIWEKEDREAYREFKMHQLGKKGFEALTVRARTLVKRNRKKAYEEVKKLYETTRL